MEVEAEESIAAEDSISAQRPIGEPDSAPERRRFNIGRFQHFARIAFWTLLDQTENMQLIWCTYWL